MANVLITIGANIGTALAKINGLSTSVNKLGAALNNVQSNKGFQSALGGISSAFNGLQNRVNQSSKSIGNFNTFARVGTSAARAVGTSMIFAGGAFRDLGVGINVASSLFQAFIPIIGAVTCMTHKVLKSVRLKNYLTAR